MASVGKELSLFQTTCNKAVITLIKLGCGKNLESDRNVEAGAQYAAARRKYVVLHVHVAAGNLEKLEFSFLRKI